MSKNNNKESIFFISSLQKYVIASTLLSLTIILELTFDNIGLPKIMTEVKIGSFFKISLIPLILIGFLLGFKYSLIFSLLYACFHVLKAFLLKGYWGYMESMNFNLVYKLSSLLLDYFLVDMLYSLSGLLYLPNFLYLDNYKKIWTNLLMIFSLVFLVKCLASYFLWAKYLPNNTNFILLCSCLSFNIIPVLINFLITGFSFCFLNPRIKIYLQNK
ncbi:putative membrane protein [Candidatus Phytoplasma solani]|uniref:hypothetical protein n=1 Tax=Candidatus Phytoplasma solani TaxID=69896 RepID=UPI0032DA8210